MKIDIVITWVDPHNKEWLEEKNYLHQRVKGRTLQYNTVANYSSYDEIKYCLRSIYKYMPWFNHIYLVTNNSAPKWLKRTKYITVIHYRDLMPDNVPSYNSNTIEAMLYKIPDLQEYFYYFNDDFILTKPVKINDLIHSTLGRLQYPKETDILFSSFQYYTILQKIEEKIIKMDTGVSIARKNSIKRMNLPNTGIVSGHTPKILNKTLCRAFNKTMSHEIDNLIKTPFRTNTNFTYLEAFIQYHNHKKISQWNNQQTKIITILDNSFLNNIQIKLAKSTIHNYDYMALEDARTQVKQEEEEKFINFLNTLFPEKAPWEH